MNAREGEHRPGGQKAWIAYSLGPLVWGVVLVLVGLGCGASPDEGTPMLVASAQPAPSTSVPEEEPRPPVESAEALGAVPEAQSSARGCSGEVRSFSFSFRSGTIPRRYSYTFEGRLRSGSVRARYRRSAMPRERGACKVVL